MIIKGLDEHTAEIATIDRLLQSEPAESVYRALRSDRAAILNRLKQLQPPSFHLEAYFRDSAGWALIHDLHLEMGAEQVHIDHLLIGHQLDAYVIDSSYYEIGLTVNGEGEYLCNKDKQPLAGASPAERLKHQVRFLRHYLEHNGLLPTRLGFSIKPTFHSIVLIAPGVLAGQATEAARKYAAVVRLEHFLKGFTQTGDGCDRAKLFAIAKQISTSTLREMATRLAQRHLPQSVDYTARYGMRQRGNVSEPLACYMCESGLIS